MTEPESILSPDELRYAEYVSWRKLVHLHDNETAAIAFLMTGKRGSWGMTRDQLLREFKTRSQKFAADLAAEGFAR